MGTLSADTNENKLIADSSKVKYYSWIIIIAGLASCLYSIINLPFLNLGIPFLILFCFTIGIGSRLTLEIPRFKARIALSDIFIFSTLLLYGGEIAILLAAVEAFCSSWRFCNKKISVFLNTAAVALSTTAVVLLLRALGLIGGIQASLYGEDLTNFFIILSIMAVTQFIFSTTISATYIALKSEQPLLETWKTKYAWSFMTYFVGAIGAGALTIASEHVGFGVVILTFPIIFFVYLTYRMYLKNVEMATAQAEQAESHAEVLEKQSAVLRESEERFRGAFDYAPIGIALVSPRGRWLKVNRALSEILGYSEEEFLASDFQSMLFPEDLGNTLVKLNELLSGKFQTCQLEQRYIHKTGRIVWVSWSISLSSETVQQHPNLIFQIQDIADRKSAEEQLTKALEESVRKYQNFYQEVIQRQTTVKNSGQIAKDERFLSRDEINELTKKIPELLTLKKLHLSNANLTDLPSEITELKELEQLSLENNRFQRFPDELLRLSNLSKLDISNNQLRELPSEIVQLYKLKRLFLSHNKISELPKEIMQLRELQELDLRGNLLPIPEEILNDYENAQKIINYYFKSRTGGPINEAKIIVIGESSVGKSSLIKRLISDTFDPNEDKTHGIEIFVWNNVIVNDQSVQLNIWDFGGQEIMHATHEFFFSNRTLYILVVNARENQNEQRADYWLTKIKSLSRNSPVIIVGSKLDQAKSDNDSHGKFQIDEYALLSKYGDIIKGFYGVCSDTRKKEYDADFIRFKTEFIKEIGKLDGIHLPFPKDWFLIKNHLENMPDDFISYEEFIRRCESRGVKERLDQETLLEFFHDLGIVLSFRRDRRLQDTQVRNPKWVTKGVYSIVESQKVKDNNGTLELEMLNDILHNKDYPPHKHLFIIDMMRKFELCYDIIPDNKFLIPGSLPTKQPYIDEWQNTLNFQYKYETYFGSIISRFIVKMHTRIDDHFVWRNGVILKYKDNKALIKADPQEKTVAISISGNEFISRDFLSMIRDKFDDIHGDYSMVIEERVPIPGQAGFYEDYQHLLNLEAMRVPELVPRGLKQKYSVEKLLNNIESEDQRQERQEKRAELKIEFASPSYKQSQDDSLMLAGDHIDSIYRLQAKIKLLEEEQKALEQTKSNCEAHAEFKTKVYSVPVYVVCVITVVAIIYYVIYAENQTAKNLLSVFSVIFLAVTIIISFVKRKDWSPSKLADHFHEKQKKRMYENFNFDENELTLVSNELSEVRRRLKKLESRQP